MRRVLVIFLILLFPLNVFALSMSVASLPHDLVAALAGSVDADAAPDSSAGASAGTAATTDCETSCDIDPDEPPSGAELHYIVGHALAPPFAGPPAAAFPPHDADRPRHFIAPPIKPPRAA